MKTKPIDLWEDDVPNDAGEYDGTLQWFASVGRCGHRGYRKVELQADTEEDAVTEAEEIFGEGYKVAVINDKKLTG